MSNPVFSTLDISYCTWRLPLSVDYLVHAAVHSSTSLCVWHCIGNLCQYAGHFCVRDHPSKSLVHYDYSVQSHVALLHKVVWALSVSYPACVHITTRSLWQMKRRAEVVRQIECSQHGHMTDLTGHMANLAGTWHNNTHIVLHCTDQHTGTWWASSCSSYTGSLSGDVGSSPQRGSLSSCSFPAVITLTWSTTPTTWPAWPTWSLKQQHCN